MRCFLVTPGRWNVEKQWLRRETMGTAPGSKTITTAELAPEGCDPSTRRATPAPRAAPAQPPSGRPS